MLYICRQIFTILIIKAYEVKDHIHVSYPSNGTTSNGTGTIYAAGDSF